MFDATRTIRPDRRWRTKQYLVLATITAITAIAAGALHLILVLTLDESDRDDLGLLIWGIVGAVALATWLITVPIIVLWHKNLAYEIERRRIMIRKGILTRTQQNIPLDMVTDFRLQRSLYDRALGIGSIQIQTAGQGVSATGYEGKLAGLEDWRDLHEDLRGRIRGSGALSSDIGLGDILDEMREIRRVLESSR
ncbi:MAG: PH domain-containing protein [Acidimicrobiia bacterium]|nr:PH domain-containing protein [Acidimicrobiia bacterium]